MHQIVLLFTCLLLIIFRPTVGSKEQQSIRSLIYIPKFHLEIRNELKMYIMDCHCWSKDNDLGLQILLPDERQSWPFRRNFMGTTLFHCRLEWERGFREFDAFFVDEDFVNQFCPNFLCVWIAKQDGLYMLNEAGQLVFHHHWKLLRMPSL